MNLTPAQIGQLLFTAAAAAGVYSFVASAQDGEARSACSALCAIHPAYAQQNKTAPDFELPDLKGNRVKLSSYKGKTVVLNFWTKTCQPCLEEMPALADFARTLKNEGEPIEVVTITTDESADDARATLQVILQGEPPFPVLIDPGGEQVVQAKFGTKLFPETWFIDPRGVIRVRIDGARDYTQPFALEVARMVHRPSGCSLSIEAGKIRGNRVEVCSDMGLKDLRELRVYDFVVSKLRARNGASQPTQMLAVSAGYV